MPKFLFKISYYNCIVVCVDAEGKESFKKYHNIKNTNQHVGKFLAFAKEKFPKATHVNFYNKDNKAFIERIYLE